MSEGQKRKTALQEIKELRGAIEPTKNDVIAHRALELSEYYLIHAENQAGHIQRLEERNKRMRGKGRWNVYYHGEENGKSIFSYSCNQCGYGAPYNFIGGVCEQKKWNFCPNCGADMRGIKNECYKRKNFE